MLKRLEAKRKELEPCLLRRRRVAREADPRIPLPHFFDGYCRAGEIQDDTKECICACCKLIIPPGRMRLFCHYVEEGETEFCGLFRCFDFCMGINGLSDQLEKEGRGLCGAGRQSVLCGVREPGTKKADCVYRRYLAAGSKAQRLDIINTSKRDPNSVKDVFSASESSSSDDDEATPKK